jgi:hypothetical protein
MLINDMQATAAKYGFRYIDQSATFVPINYGTWGRQVQAFRDGWNARRGDEGSGNWKIFGNDLEGALDYAAN